MQCGAKVVEKYANSLSFCCFAYTYLLSIQQLASYDVCEPQTGKLHGLAATCHLCACACVCVYLCGKCAVTYLLSIICSSAYHLALSHATNWRPNCQQRCTTLWQCACACVCALVAFKLQIAKVLSSRQLWAAWLADLLHLSCHNKVVGICEPTHTHIYILSH